MARAVRPGPAPGRVRRDLANLPAADFPLATSWSCRHAEHDGCKLRGCMCQCHIDRARERLAAGRELEAYWREAGYAHAHTLAGQSWR